MSAGSINHFPSEPPKADFGRFEAIALLGEGGMASVYLAHPRGSHASNKLLVIKQLRPELARHDTIRTMFLDEGRLASRLNHRNVVQLYEVVEGDYDYFLAMEYLEGQPYGHVASRLHATESSQKLAVELHILTEVLAGLHYAHELADFDGTPLRVVHRDVSPHNVFVTYDGLVKVVDFGIAKAADATTSTESGVFKGKASYAAPEQVTGEPVDRRADIFSVGVMLWEAISGRRLWGSVPNSAIFAQIVEGKWRTLREVAPETPPDLVAIVDRAMMRHPKDRYDTAEQMRSDLERYVRNGGLALTPHELGRLVTERFAEERTLIRRRIEQHMIGSRQKASLHPGADGGSFDKSGEYSQRRPRSRDRERSDSGAGISTDSGLDRLQRSGSNLSHLAALSNKQDALGDGSVSVHIEGETRIERPPIFLRTAAQSRAVLLGGAALVLVVCATAAFVAVVSRRDDPRRARPSAALTTSDQDVPHAVTGNEAVTPHAPTTGVPAPSDDGPPKSGAAAQVAPAADPPARGTPPPAPAARPRNDRRPATVAPRQTSDIDEASPYAK